MLSTVSSLLAIVAAIVAVFAAMRAAMHEDGARSSEHELLKQRGQLLGLQAAHEALVVQHRKLSGRFYAFLQHSEEDAMAEHPPAVTHPDGVAGFCENWATACREGPNSAAAKCECAYCTEMRARRSSVRQALMPAARAATLAEAARK